ncbi:MAG: PD-(D/E)XK nuclease family protein [Actinomycetota bacterium]
MLEHGINRLAEGLRELCASRVYEEKWLLAPSLRTGYQWLDTVSRCGQPALNVRVKTTSAMALELAAPEMERQGLTLLGGMRMELLAAGLLVRLRRGGGYLAHLEASPGLVRAAVSTLGALRRCGLEASDLSIRHFEVAQKGMEIISLLTAYEEELSTRGLIDLAGAIRLAAQRLETDSAALPAHCLVAASRDLVDELRGLERRMWEAVPEEKRLVIPSDRPCEERGGESGNAALLAWIPAPREAPAAGDDGSVRMFRAVGEANEVREVLRRCGARGIPYDRVEVLHTDTATYVPLFHEICSAVSGEDGDLLPVTFAEGIPVLYSRPGRALAAWLSWIEDGFPQPTLVRMVQEGLLSPGEDLPDGWSFSRLGGILRALPIGKGRERYLAAIDAELESLVWRRAHRALEEDGEEDVERPEHLERREKMLGVLRGMVEGLLDGIPAAAQAGSGLLRAAEDFLVARARVVSEMDDYSRLRLLDGIRELASLLRTEGVTAPPQDINGWLEDLARSARVEGKGPRPGCLYVAPLAGGGHSGRPHTFIVGLDDGRFPGTGLQDPLLLDTERAAISPDLSTAAERLAASLDDFARLAAGLRGSVTLSYSCRDLGDDSDMFPSPVLLAAYRIVSGNREGVQDDLLAWLPEPASFAPRDPVDCLNSSEWWLCRLCGEPAPQDPEGTVALAFPHLGRGMEARRARESDLFTAYDGYVPEAGQDLDPAAPGGPVLSASRLQTLGSCPLEYFFSYVLGIEPPEEYPLDPTAWLEPTEKGGLLHAVFHAFLLRLCEEERRPVLEKDWGLLRKLLDDEIRAWTRRKPPPNREVHEREIEDLRRTARIFLQEEEGYCREWRPRFFEVAVGFDVEERENRIDSPQPVEIALPSGKTIRTRGYIDRIDELEGAGSPRFSVCDYKTGSSYPYSQGNPFQQGRCIQNLLYLMQAQYLLSKDFPGAEIESFQYFFPNTREHGRRIAWAATALADGIHILDRLCEMLSLGCFSFTDEEKDVRYSDYRAAFGYIPRTLEQTKRKLANAQNVALSPFRELRSMKKGGG